nr:hypothetical protein [Tanacetum cinerariifolium]
VQGWGFLLGSDGVSSGSGVKAVEWREEWGEIVLWKVARNLLSLQCIQNVGEEDVLFCIFTQLIPVVY